MVVKNYKLHLFDQHGDKDGKELALKKSIDALEEELDEEERI